MSAIHEIISLHIRELLRKAFAVLVLLLVTRGVAVEAVRNHNALEAVILAGSNAWLVFLGALEKAEVVLLVNKCTEVLVQVREGPGVERLLICHYF